MRETFLKSQESKLALKNVLFCQFFCYRIREIQISADPNQKHLFKRYKNTLLSLWVLSSSSRIRFWRDFVYHLCYRNLFKTVSLILKTHQIPIDSFTAALRYPVFQIVRILKKTYFVWFVFCRAIQMFKARSFLRIRIRTGSAPDPDLDHTKNENNKDMFGACLKSKYEFEIIVKKIWLLVIKKPESRSGLDEFRSETLPLARKFALQPPSLSFQCYQEKALG
jgi:hypothetical protein